MADFAIVGRLLGLTFEASALTKRGAGYEIFTSVKNYPPMTVRKLADLDTQT
jgi:hypothetical protein